MKFSEQCPQCAPPNAVPDTYYTVLPMIVTSPTPTAWNSLLCFLFVCFYVLRSSLNIFLRLGAQTFLLLVFSSLVIWLHFTTFNFLSLLFLAD